MNDKKVSSNLKSFYTAQFDQHGPTPLGLSWRDQESADLRYNRMLNVVDTVYISKLIPTILDVGCGYGGMLGYINEKTNLKVDYHGIDIVPESIDAAKKKYGDKKFDLADIADFKSAKYDYVVCNGVLTLKNQATLIEMESFAKTVIKKMFKICKIGIAFNMLTTHVRHFASINFYKNPLEIFAYCLSNLSLNVKIDHSYRLFEYTVYLYKTNESLKNEDIEHLGYQ